MDPASWTMQTFTKIPLVAACINETLRMYNTAVGAHRIAIEDIELGGYMVPKGTVHISDIYSMHRNEVVMQPAVLLFALEHIHAKSAGHVFVACCWIFYKANRCCWLLA